MAQIKSILGTDVIRATYAVINANFAALNTAKAELSGANFTGIVNAPNISGNNTGDQTLNSLLPSQSGAAGKYLSSDGTNATWQPITGASGGTVTSLPDAVANGFNFTWTSRTTVPQLVPKINVTGILIGNATSGIIGAAVPDTVSGDYVTPIGTGVLQNKTISNSTIVKPVMNATNPTAGTYSPSSGGTAVLDCGNYNQHRVTFPTSGQITLATTGDTNSQIFIVTIIQSSTGSQTLASWFGTIKWPGAIVPTLTTTAGKKDVFGFIRTGANTYDGFIIGQNL